MLQDKIVELKWWFISIAEFQNNTLKLYAFHLHGVLCV
jgi:hypothetical protein